MGAANYQRGSIDRSANVQYGNAAQEQLGHSTTTMTAQYIRHRRGKLVKPTK